MLTQKCTTCNDSLSRQLLIKDHACLINVAWSFLHFFSIALASLLLIILKPVQSLQSLEIHGGIREWWWALPLKEKELFNERVRKEKKNYSLGWVVVVCYLRCFILLPWKRVQHRKAQAGLMDKSPCQTSVRTEYEAWMEEFLGDMLRKMPKKRL